MVLIDEAHNVPEALRQLHSSQLSLPVIEAAIQQLTRYTQTYAQRLAGRNLMYLGNLRKVLQAFSKYLKQNQKQQQGINPKTKNNNDKENNQSRVKGDTKTTGAAVNHSKRTLQSTGEFILELKIDNVNLFKLLRYLEHSRLSQKLLGFTRARGGNHGDDNHQDQQDINGGLSKHVSAMSIVQTFLEKLNLKGQEGKIVTHWPTTQASGDNDRVQHPTLRYVLLQPASCFENILEEAHALALVGGTLSPMGHVAAELLSSDHHGDDQNQSQPAGNDSMSLLELAVQSDETFQKRSKNENKSNNSTSFVTSQFAAFTCDHVVPASNVMVKCLSFGPGKVKFDFRHQSRMASSLCDELGKALISLSKVIPFGLVVFLPSYSYEAHLVSEWKQSGLWNKLYRRKKIFREPKSAQHLDATLQSYAEQAGTGGLQDDEGDGVKTAGGALLLAVIGGKMSEGINLSNNMARGVVVVGLPYPDITDPELQEKMSNMTSRGIGGITGQAYYQNLCMRAVNQSIGRAIRHANDYAAIILCDFRYAAQPKIWSGLPNWVRNAASSSMDPDGMPHRSKSDFSSMTNDLFSFFQTKGP